MNDRKPRQPETRINWQIKAFQVRVMKDDEQLGVMSTDAARKIAQEAGLDLVEVASCNPPVCKIMDYGKFKYEQSVKEKEKKKKQKQSQNNEKEIRLGPSIGHNDLMIKMVSAKKFLSDGHRVHIRLQYEKRENAHKELGFVVVQKVIAELAAFGSPQQPPRLEGNKLNCIIEPKSKNV